MTVQHPPFFGKLRAAYRKLTGRRNGYVTAHIIPRALFNEKGVIESIPHTEHTEDAVRDITQLLLEQVGGEEAVSKYVPKSSEDFRRYNKIEASGLEIGIEDGHRYWNGRILPGIVLQVQKQPIDPSELRAVLDPIFAEYALLHAHNGDAIAYIDNGTAYLGSSAVEALQLGALERAAITEDNTAIRKI